MRLSHSSRWVLGLAGLLLGCTASDAGDSGGAPVPTGPRTLQVTVAADGTFSPQHLTIRSGDTVEWLLHDSADAIAPATVGEFPATCSSRGSFDPNDPNELTGPMPIAPAGVFSLGPFEAGYVVKTGGCELGDPAAVVGDQYLCHGGEVGATLDETWENPQIAGVFIRGMWNRVQLAPGTDDSSFDFSEIDREIDQAVAHGKLYSLNFKAGNDGTPDWLFSTDADGTPRANGGGGVKRLRFRDGGSDDVAGCGVTMDLGNPTEGAYKQHYFDLLKKVAEHLRARADRYRALAYLKIGGANLFSAEARLPRRCDTGCFCNTELWAQNGYTPSKLYAFYAEQDQLLRTEFPDKTVNYMLIQDGFPSVNENGDYELSDGTSSGGPLPTGVEQTEKILAQEQDALGDWFSVAHNGVGVKPPSGTCPNEGKHPAIGPYAKAGTGCPNHWVLKAGSLGQVTGFQTNNASGVSTPAHVESALSNVWDNSDGIYLELYEARIWEIEHAGAAGKTLGEWSTLFQERRRELHPQLPDPGTLVHRRTFSATAPRVIHYVHTAKCDGVTPAYGSIEILP
jgi:hypothetical protein